MGMREPFEIVDPIESFTEAREAVSAGVETSTQGRTISNQALLAGAAIFAISILILVNTLSPRMFAPKVDNQLASDTASPRHALSRQPGSDPPDLLDAPAPSQSVHAIEPGASATQSFESSATPEATEAPSHPGLGDQLFKIVSVVSIRNGPSPSADIIGMAYAGTVARVASRDSGWTQIVDPSSGKSGWIDSSVLSPLMRTADTASTEDSPPKQMSEEGPAEALNEQDFEIPDENALPAVKAKRHGSNRKHDSNRRYGRVFPLRFAVRLFRR
jgi:hypothetical protein